MKLSMTEQSKGDLLIQVTF